MSNRATRRAFFVIALAAGAAFAGDDPLRVPLLTSGAAAEGATAGSAPLDVSADESAANATGAASRMIPLRVPEFFGIEPHLALAYHSRGGDGAAGVGWSLTGLSAIRQVGARRGIPSFTPADHYTLDGEDLFPCDGGPPLLVDVPGCKYRTGNPNHEHFFQKHQSGLRIVFDHTQWIDDPTKPPPGWIVWTQDGTRREYRARQFTANMRQQASWLLSSVTDVSGNTVSYQYTPETDPQRYLTGVTYNGVRITVYWENRPDYLPYAMGDGTQASMRSRIKTVDVQTLVGDAPYRTRVYALRYTLNSATWRSLLAQVQEYGADAMVDPFGTVTAGTSLPPYRFEYGSEADYGHDPHESRPVSLRGPTVTLARGTPLSLSDTLGPFDTFAEHLPPELYWHGVLSTKEGGHIEHVSADVDDDGRLDHIIAYFGSTTTFRLLAKGNDSPVTVPISVPPSEYWNNKLLIADVDGDHRQDLLFIFCYDRGRPCRALSMRYRTDTNDFAVLPEVVLPWGLPSKQPVEPRIAVADVNGDGLADLVARPLSTGSFSSAGGTWKIEAMLGRGDGTFEAPLRIDTGMDATVEDQLLVGDYDGDGRDDLILVGAATRQWKSGPDVWVPAGGTKVRICWATSLGPFTASPFSVSSTTVPLEVRIGIDERLYRQTWLAADVNGDGRADVVRISGDRIEAVVAKDALGDYVVARTNHRSPRPFESVGGWQVRDVNRDGRADFVVVPYSYTPNIEVGTFPPPAPLPLHVILSRPLPGSDSVDFEFRGAFDSLPYYPKVPVTDRVSDACVDSAAHAIWCTTTPLAAADVGDVDGDGNLDVIAWSIEDHGPPANCSEQPESLRFCGHDVTWKQMVLSLGSPGTEPNRWITADVDGDGRQDMVAPVGTWDVRPTIDTRLRRRDGTFAAIAVRSTLSTPIRPQTTRVADINGDGAQDLVWIEMVGNTIHVVTAVYEPGAAGNGVWKQLGSEFTATFGSWMQRSQRNFHVVDVDGDGKSDVVYLQPFANALRYRVFTSLGDGDFVAWPPVTLTMPGLTAGNIDWHPLDVNRDGASDFVGVWDQPEMKLGVYTIMSNRDGTYRLARYDTPPRSYSHGPRNWIVTDLTGDGVPDLLSLHIVPDDPASPFHVVRAEALVGTGDGAWKGSYPLGPVGRVRAGNLSAWATADMNGDGRTDLIAKSFVNGVNGSNGTLAMTVYYSRNSWSDTLTLQDTPPELIQNAPFSDVTAFRPHDRDADTWSDLEYLAWDEAAGAFSVRSIVPLARYDYLIKEISPLGGTVSFDYDTFADQDVTPVDSLALYGVRCWSPPFAGHVVSAVTVNAEAAAAPVGGIERLGTVTRYAYHCGQWSPAERQFMAFRAIDTTEEQLNRDPATSLLFSSDFISRPARKTRTTYDATDQCDARLLEVRQENAKVSTETVVTRTAYPDAGSNAPFVCNPERVERTDPAAGADAMTSATATHYDEFVAPAAIIEYGEKSESGDERVTRIQRTILPQPYIVTVTTHDVYAGEVPDAAKKLRSTHYCYDAALTFDNPDRLNATKASGCSPRALIRGLLTAQLDCIDTAKCEDDARDTLALSDGGSPAKYLWAASTFEYDAAGNRTATFDADGHGTRVSYFDPFPTHLFPWKVTDAAGDVTTRTWDYNLGVPLVVTDPSGAEAHSAYDPLARPIETKTVIKNGTTTVESDLTTIAYTFTGGPVSVTYSKRDDGSTLGLWETVAIDGLGREIERRRAGSPDRAGNARKFQLRTLYADASSLPYQSSPWTTVGAASIPFETFQYDHRGRLRNVQHADGSTAAMGYTVKDHREVANQTDEEGHRRAEVRDVYGRTVRVDEPHGGTTVSSSFQWRLDDSLLAATDPAGDVVRFERDALGRLTGMSDPDLGIVAYRHDPAGNQLASKDARGHETLFTYDSRNRPVNVAYGARIVHYLYDETSSPHGFGRGRLTSIVDSDVNCNLDGDGTGRATSLEYDQLGRIVTHRKCLGGGISGVMRWDYDMLGRMASITYPDSERVLVRYGEGGEVVRLANEAATPPVVYATNIVHDETGRPTQIVLGNGVTESYDYDERRHFLVHMSITDAQSRMIFDANYLHYFDRQIEHIDLAGLHTSSTRFAYDAQHRLTAAGTDTFKYDVLGNLATRNGVTYTYPTPGPGATGVHAVRNLGGTESFSYDACGNLETHTTQAGKRTYTWDDQNRLAKIKIGTNTTTIAYDADGKRLAKTAPDGTTTRYFSPFVEIDKAGQLVKFYRLGERTIARRDGAGTTAPLVFLHQDHLGSTIAVTAGDGASAGETIAGSDYTYDTFGAQADTTRNPLLADSVLFTQSRQDAETSPDAGAGLIDLGARFYDPRAAHFLSADTAMVGSSVLGMNRYAYAMQNPLFYVDPTGHSPRRPDDEENPGESRENYDRGDTRVIFEKAPPETWTEQARNVVENIAFDSYAAPALLMLNTAILGQGLGNTMDAIAALRPHKNLGTFGEAMVFAGSLLVPMPGSTTLRLFSRLSLRGARLFGMKSLQLGFRRGSPEFLLQAAHELHARVIMNAAGKLTGREGYKTVGVALTAEGHIVAAVSQGHWGPQARAAAEALGIRLLEPGVNIPPGNWVHAETQLATQNVVRWEGTRPMCPICTENTGLADKQIYTGIRKP